MKRLVFSMIVCLSLSCTPVCAGIPAYAAEEEAGTVGQDPEDTLPRHVEDMEKELALALSCLERLEAQHAELMAVPGMLRSTNSMLLILVAMEFMRLVRGWTKGGRHSDGSFG